ncbi:17S U2 SnRNP complex component HTATSF1-like [Clavelina lepadiformis]|uniref:17S U2 SnRNP complex component HTATSF1-like n=1 Tax=Clavelina lepadiformis TaxID=159417 RepID=UPI004042A951
MSMKPEDYQEFQRQLELENAKETVKKDNGVKTKKDEDGTEYEWDEEKKAWFPKFSVDQMMAYQSSYTGLADNINHDQSGASKTTYLDPQTKVKYEWDGTEHKWKPLTANNYVYTDQSTGLVYTWNATAQKWNVVSPVKLNKNTSAQSENDGNISDNETFETQEKDSFANSTKVPKEGSAEKNNNAQIYIHPETGEKYHWNLQKQVWTAEDGTILYPAAQSGNSQSYENDKTGKVYSWNQEQNKWIEADNDGKQKAQVKKGKVKATKRAASKAEWFDAEKEKNTNVYVSGLPLDISQAEFHDIMSKCGIITPNPKTGEPKVKLYTDNKGNLKGDGLCCYLKKESLPLAIQILDGTKIRGYTLSVQEAHFELKGDYDASKKPKMLSKKEKKKINKEREKLLDWKLARSEEAVSKTERVVIFKNMFDTNEFEEDPVQITEIRDDIRKECEKFGPVKKVIVFDRHPDGVCSVAFKANEDAKKCQQALNGRWFACKMVEANIWDGVTNYQIEETDKEREVRLKKWNDYLCEDDETKKSENDSNKSEVEQYTPETSCGSSGNTNELKSAHT